MNNLEIISWSRSRPECRSFPVLTKSRRAWMLNP